jgi:ribosomal protein L20A (L18A)
LRDKGRKMDSIYKILESLDKVEEGRYDGPNSSCCDAPILNYDSDTKLGICSDCKDHASPHEDEEELDEGQYDGKSREELLKMKAEAEASIKNMKSSGNDPQSKFYDETQMMMAQQHLDSINNALKKVGESVEEAEITPIDHSEDDYDGASVEDIASAITRRMMNAKNFGALVREIDILDLNDAIESVAEFHEGGDLGTSDVSNMVRDVLKQLGKEDMKLEDVEVKEMIGYYTIYKDGKVVATGVRATSESDAINQAYMKMGSASKYTGAGRDSFKAVREEAEVKEQDVEEDNAFNTAAANAKKAGQSHFMFNGKKYKVQMDADTADALTDDVNEDYDKDEYDEEGEMADNQLDVVHDAAQELQDIIDSDDNLPEWVQSKITKAMDYLDTARDYMKSVEDDEESADDVEPPKDEEVEETTVAGAVATSADGAGVYKNASVYEGYNSRVDNMITEGMSVNISASDEGEPSVNVNATGEDAMALAQLLQLAAVPQGPQQMTKKVCKNCGDEQGKPEHMDCPYDCMDPMGENFMEVACEADEANSADNGVTYDMHYLINSISGGLNGPKRQINPNNPGDNPMAMTGIGKDTLNMSQQVSEGEDVKSHLETLYKEFKSK